MNPPKWSGKRLVPDPDRAPLIARAFEELATGRFTKQEGESADESVVSQTFTSWNQMAAWLRQIDGVRRVA